MKRSKQKYKHVIIGCNLRFGATEETFKSCDTCSLTRTDNECLDDIMVAERHYVYQKVSC